MTINNRTTHTPNNTLPAVPPWAGSTIYNGKVVRLRNTCPIDNLLTMFHFICTLYPAIVQAEKDLFYQRIMSVYKYFNAGEFVLGKLHWLEFSPHKVDLTKSVIDNNIQQQHSTTTFNIGWSTWHIIQQYVQ